MTDEYKTITDHIGEGFYSEKRSKFLAFAHHVNDVEDVKRLVAEYRKKYYDARHVCYAYVLGNAGESTRAQDDGEPSGTAGRPILGQIISRGLTYVMVLVVRYFGGVKLGTGPLGVAYKTVAGEALDEAEKETCIVCDQIKVAAPYAEADVAMRFVREAGADITARDYTATEILLTESVRLDDEAKLRERLAKILTLRFIP